MTNDLATLQKDFVTFDDARKAAKPHTKERAAAATKAAQTASDIGWLIFDKNESALSADWFARRAALKKEAYDNSRAYWEEYLGGEVAANEKQFSKKIADWKNKFNKESGDAEKKSLQDGIGALVRMQRVLRYNAISMLESLARDNDDSSTRTKYSLQELEVRRTELSDLQELHAPLRETEIKKSEVAKALERLADAQAASALFEDAEKNYQKALVIRNSLSADLPERKLHETLTAIGAMYLHKTGEISKARDYYTRALEEWDKTTSIRQAALDAEKTAENKDMTRGLNALSELNIVANLGSAFEEGGDYGAAQKYFERALAASQSLPDGGYLNFFTLAKATMRVRVLSEFAELHLAIGEHQQAAKELEECIAIKRDLGNDENTANTLLQAARLYYAQGDLKSAKRYVEQARLFFVQAQHLQSVVNATAFLSTIAREENDLPTAAKWAEAALPLARQSGNIGVAAGALRTLASIRLDQNRLDEANLLLEEAARFDERTGSILDRIATLERQGQVMEARSQNEVALGKYKAAVALLETIRTTTNSQNFGENHFTAKAYERLVLLLIKMQRTEEAFDYLGRARSKQLQESLRLTSLKTNDPQLQHLLERVSTLETALQTTRGQLQTERAKPASQQDVARIDNLQSLIASTQGEYRRVLEQIKTAHPNYEKVLSVNPKQLKEAQRSIPQDTALIQFAPLENQFFIFVVTKEKLQIFEPKISLEELWKRIKATRRQITRPTQNTLSTRGAALAPAGEDEEQTLRENLVALYLMLIAPIESTVADKSTLAFIPTQLLYYLPFAALAKEENGKLHFLIEDKLVVNLSASDVMRVVQAPDATKMKDGLIAFGDPTGANLPAAREEVLSISKIFPNAKSLTDAQVTKAAVTNEALLQERVVHFATHGILNAAAPDRSYIQLAQNASPESAQLTVGEVWNLPLGKVDLVTLSACETAIAQGSPDGGEITTLAEAFSSAGAQSVIATLWSVADGSTKMWMVEFYTQLASGKTKGQAFRTAQLKLLQSAEYSHPYFWAPFILMGDWR